MSDNPADSLRRELEAALRERPPCEHSTRYGKPTRRTDHACAECDVDAIWPLLEAARADERERIATAIEKRLLSRNAGGYDEGWDDAMRTAAAEARAVSDGN